MCEGDAATYFRSSRSRFGPSGIEASRSEPRRSYPAALAVADDVAPTAARRRRRCGTRQADHRRWHLLQPRQRPLAADTLIAALRADALDARSLSVYQQRWRERLGPELQAQLALRMLAQRMSDQEIDSLFDLALTDGVMPIVRRTARFNRHRNLIVALFKHAPARRLLFRRLVTA